MHPLSPNHEHGDEFIINCCCCRSGHWNFRSLIFAAPQLRHARLEIHCALENYYYSRLTGYYIAILSLDPYTYNISHNFTFVIYPDGTSVSQSIWMAL